MTNRLTVAKTALCCVAIALPIAVIAYAQTELYEVHDMNRPPVPIVTPPDQVGMPPSDAIILFGGEDTSEWAPDRGTGPIKWNVKDGYMEVARKAGGIHTVQKFGNCQLHIEWRTPKVVKGDSQGRGNSGIFFMGRYELQMLDSYNNPTYPDGQAAAIYGQHPPMVNVCRGPGEWQVYDVAFMRPIFDDDGDLVRPARITVMHNGVVVHNNLPIEGATAHKRKARYRRHDDEAPLSLQDHGNPTAFRNIWIRRLPEQPYLIKD